MGRILKKSPRNALSQKWLQSPSMRALALVVGIGVCLFAFRKIDLPHFRKVLASADWRFLIAAVLVNLVFNTMARALRFFVLLSPLACAGPRPKFREIVSMLMATRALNMILPARAGETVRTFRLHRRHGYPVPSILAILVIEPLIDTLSLGLPAFVLLFFESPPPNLAIQLYTVGLLGISGLALIVLIGQRREKVSVSSAIQNTSRTPPKGLELIRTIHRSWLDAFHFLNSPKTWAQALLCSWASDLSDMAMVGLCLAAVSISLGPVHWFIILVVINVAIAIPATPGAIGLLEAGTVLALSAFGVDRNQALAFAIFYHAVHIIPVVVLGALSLMLSKKYVIP